MADDRTFFEIAAALLPALMFGGLLSDRLKPPRTVGARYHNAVIGVTAAGAFLLLAEFLAIDAAISGEPTSLARGIVVIAVVGTSSATLAMLLIPWVRKLHGRERTTATVGMSALPLLTCVGASVLLSRSVQISTVQERTQELEDLQQQFEEIQRQQVTLRNRESAEARRFASLTDRFAELPRQASRGDWGQARLKREVRETLRQQRLVQNEVTYLAGEIDRLSEQQINLLEQMEALD